MQRKSLPPKNCKTEPKNNVTNQKEPTFQDNLSMLGLNGPEDTKPINQLTCAKENRKSQNNTRVGPKQKLSQKKKKKKPNNHVSSNREPKTQHHTDKDKGPAFCTSWSLPHHRFYSPHSKPRQVYVLYKQTHHAFNCIVPK